jgi:hypothetical protein
LRNKLESQLTSFLFEIPYVCFEMFFKSRWFIKIRGLLTYNMSLALYKIVMEVMDMAYSDFTTKSLESQFGITFKRANLFGEITPIEPSQHLSNSLAVAKLFTLTTEKAKSEAIIFPIMAEVKEKNIDKVSIFSGESIEADKSKGLLGECDFVITADPELISLRTPIISIIEAKKDSADLGLAQCTAQLIGAKMIHEQQGKEIKAIYGCITNSEDWQFLKLEGTTVSYDINRYYINEVHKILGVFQNIIDSYYNVQ